MTMKLESVLDMAPSLQTWYDEEISVLVMDEKEVLAFYPHPNLDFGFHAGQPTDMYQSTISYRAIKTKERQVSYVSIDESQFKIPYVAISSPIMDGNVFQGVLTIIFSSEKFDTLLMVGEELLSAVEELYASSENLSAQSEELAATAKSMEMMTGQVTNEVENVTNITTAIKRISQQSNILGINASIESARAGEHGRGFAVVADEVRKLAEGTKGSAVEIEEDLLRVHKSIKELVYSVNQLAVVSDHQANGVVELTKALNQISNMAEKLVEMGKRK